MRLKQTVWSLRTSRRYAHVAEEQPPDLLFCPFTVPYFWQSGTPCVSIVYDLQHLTYPEFFTHDQRLNRQRHIADACARSERVVCISDYVRGRLLANVEVCPPRVVTIPLGVLHDPASPDPSILDRLGLRGTPFLLYPANFWPHKNHATLFEAMRLRQPSPLRLVCTGVPNAYMRTLQETAQALLPPDQIVFAGYVREQELAALLEACAALIFPSLYEGFGMPVLEAMACGKPVLTSNVTSLPEVGGDAAIYFDPKQPSDIAAAIEVLQDDRRVADLVQRGLAWSATFGDGKVMAERYLAIFEQVWSASR
jgi:glycosyltransferase involved in cell wall biosynthesis